MTNSLQGIQSDLPTCFPLFRYNPERKTFNWKQWKPSDVKSIDDLPQYLLLGKIDRKSFHTIETGWFARWQGKEKDTFLNVTFDNVDQSWNVLQSWCGNEVKTSYTAKIPLDELIQRVLYLPIPPSWERSIKTQFETLYQISAVENKDTEYGYVGVPDGLFKTIAFPVALYNLRPVRLWLKDFCKTTNPQYPIYAEVRQIFQSVSYVEGRAPDWTKNDLRLFHQSVSETGLIPQALPVREVGQNGTAAWTLQRLVYYVFVHVPLSGLTEFLEHMATEDGPIRRLSDPKLRFEWQPLLIPEMFEITCESVAFWDSNHSVRLYLQFRFKGQEVSLVSESEVREVTEHEPQVLSKLEEVSRTIVNQVNEMTKTGR